MTTIEVLPQSWMSLYIEMFFNDEKLGSGTAFIVKHKENYFLITNRHNVRGRDNNTNKVISKTGAIPNKIAIHFNKSRSLGEWIRGELDLYRSLDDESSHIWYEHPTLGAQADVIALHLENKQEIDYYPHELNSTFNIKLFPSDSLSVVGYPYGKKSHGYLAIWTTGFLATDMDLNYDNLPIFLIDCRTRRGQSGSPVLAQRNGSNYINTEGKTCMVVGHNTKLLGIYSGRVNEESDLGFVWKIKVIEELLDSIKIS